MTDYGKFVQAARKRVPPAAFYRITLIASILWFLGLLPALVWLHPVYFDRVFFNGVEQQSTMPCDFPQYYMGALAFEQNDLGSLYPDVDQSSYGASVDFKPKIVTPLFESMVSNNEIFHHKPAMYPEMADVSPKLLRLSPKLEHYFHYIYPPPLAILLAPLAFWDIETAAFKIWPTIAALSLFGTCFFSGRIHRVLSGKVSYIEGLIMVAMILFSFRGRTDFMYSGNATPILGFLITFATYAWIRGWQVSVATAIVPLLLFKAIGLTWIPLLLLRKTQWKTLSFLALLTISLNAIMIWRGGIMPYKTFFFEIIPYLNVPAGAGLTRQILDWFGIYPSGIYMGLTLVPLVLLYIFYHNSRKNKSAELRQRVIIATLAGTMAVFCILNFSVWLPYFPNYLFFPFLGWMIWEGMQSRGRWRLTILGSVSVGIVVCVFEWLIKAILFRLGGKELVNLYHDFLMVPIFVFIIPVIFLVVSMRRLVDANSSDLILSPVTEPT